MASGLHGVNGLDPASACKIVQTFVVPVMTYGLEVIMPSKNELSPLERSFKKLLKQILSLPTTTADAAVYVITGFMPLEA
jgi:hypothetical protein